MEPARSDTGSSMQHFNPLKTTLEKKSRALQQEEEFPWLQVWGKRVTMMDYLHPKKKLWQKYKYILWSLFLLTRRAVINKPYFYLIAKRSKNVWVGKAKRGSMALTSSFSQNLTHPQVCCEARIPWTERGWTIHATLSLAGIERHKMWAGLLQREAYKTWRLNSVRHLKSWPLH